MGFNGHFKLHPDNTQKNYWRFRQHVPFDDAKYVTKKLSNGNELVLDYTKHKFDHDRNAARRDHIVDAFRSLPGGL